MSNESNKLEETKEKREALIKEIMSQKYDYIEITEKDKKANALYYSKVKPSFQFQDDFYFNLAMKYKSEIESNIFFKDLQQMPKGCLLHHHFVDCINIKWIADTVMKEGNLENIYMRRFRDKYDILIYTVKPNLTKENPDQPFKEIIDQYLIENKDKTPYDYFFKKLTINYDEIENVKNNSEAWEVFMPKYFFCQFLIFYKEFYKEHVRNTFMQCVEDKQYRIESRITPGCIRDENYEFIGIDEEMKIYQDELKYINLLKLETKFTFGIIFEIIRNKKDEFITEKINLSMELKKKYPEIICAVDFSGDEDHFRSLEELTPVMLKNTDPNLPFILHCGESLKAQNYNLIDGLLLNTKRFGHCINLFKLGKLYETIKNKKIVLEINPISNQTLRQVRDLRLHPCIGYHNQGIKICINNDDPTLYNTKGVAYDFFVSAAVMEFDLLDFKCFGLNSIDGAQINDELNKEYKNKFLKSWNEFLDYFINKYESN